jgi:hypothetical protein
MMLMNTLSLAAFTVGLFIFSTLPNLAQEISAPFGFLNMESTIPQAESALKTKSYSNSRGGVKLSAKFNGRDYHMTFTCPNTGSACDKRDMIPVRIVVIYTNEIIFDIRPRQVRDTLEDFGFGHVEARYDTSCAFWNTKTSIVNVGRVCGEWGIRMRNRKFPWNFSFGVTPCTEYCF